MPFSASTSSILAYCYHDQTKDLPCILLGTARFTESSLCNHHRNTCERPVLLTEDLLAETHCIPVRHCVFDLPRFTWAEALADRIDPVPQEKNTILLSKICGVCVHHIGRHGPDLSCLFRRQSCGTLERRDRSDDSLQGISDFSGERRGIFLEVFETLSGKVLCHYEVKGNPHRWNGTGKP
ncbi:MAG TPA: hypothetical protein O0X23_02860 [Methanocorpusculum sp.]|nr:hypothetical protein [Methanocorpusculum sp.]